MLEPHVRKRTRVVPRRVRRINSPILSDLYNKKIFKRIDEFEKSFSETDKDYICISFPSAVMLPTKKGNYDFGFNLQEIMVEHNIIITGLLLRNPNDNISMDEILSELKENFNLLLELVEKYGCRRNYKEIKKNAGKSHFCFLIQDITQIKT